MKPASFAYRAPTSLEELLELLRDQERDVRVLAGGQSLVPMMNFRRATPEMLVDLGRVAELRALRQLPHGELAVGAGVRQAQLLRDEAVAAGWPLLAAGVRHIGHPQIRSRGTVCGSLAHHDPTAELPALAVALEARMSVASARGRRIIEASDFFVSSHETALEPGELLVDVRFPAQASSLGWSFRELARRRSDVALVGAVATLTRDSGVARAPRLVLFGVGDRPTRIVAVEQALAGARFGASAVSAVAPLVAEAIAPVDDDRASAEYRAEVAGDLATAALAEAWERSAGG